MKIYLFFVFTFHGKDIKRRVNIVDIVPRKSDKSVYVIYVYVISRILTLRLFI